MKPVKKTTKRRTGQRRSHHALSKSTFGICNQCSLPVRPHHACASCGSYRTTQSAATATPLENSQTEAKHPSS